MRILKDTLSILYLKFFALLRNYFVGIRKLLLKLKCRAENTVVEKNIAEELFIIRSRRPCHFQELFINYKGEIFPCCLSWPKPNMKIGHIDDSNLLERIRNFYRPCNCALFELKKADLKNSFNYAYIIIELLLFCQGKCAMCSVNAPQWQGEYHYYDSLTRLINVLSPKQILVQGGEVLMQRESMEWISGLRKIYPGLQIIITTNGNVDLDIIEKVEELFYGVHISFVGFQPDTYTTVMGMDVHKAMGFAQVLAKRKKVRLVLKYLTTPLTIHEFSLFLKWAITLSPAQILVDDADTLGYINLTTPDEFWEKIFERTRRNIKNALVQNKCQLLVNNIALGFSVKTIEILRLKSVWQDFLEETGLRKNIFIYD